MLPAKLAFCFALVPLLFVWYGYALTKLWDWFLVSTFGVPALSIPVAIGLMIMLSLVIDGKVDYKKSTEETVETFVSAAFWMTTKPALVLGIGWLVTWWM